MSLTLSCPTIRVLKTFLIFAAYGSVGWSDSLLGVNLLDFHIKLHVDIEDMSNVITASYAGITIGSTICKYFPLQNFSFGNCTFSVSCGCNKINVHLVYLICLLVTSISLAIAPHLNSILWLSFALFMNGLASGAINSASISRILYLWGHECSSFLQILDFMYGVGSIVGPLAASPFLVEIPDLQMDMELYPEEFNISTPATITNNSGTKNSTENSVHFVTAKDMKLVYPYSMVSGFMAITFFICALLFLVEPNDVPHSSRVEDNPDLIANQDMNGQLKLGQQKIQATSNHDVCLGRSSSLPSLQLDLVESTRDNKEDNATPRKLDCGLQFHDNFRMKGDDDKGMNVDSKRRKVIEWSALSQETKPRTKTIGSSRELRNQKSPLAKMASFPIMGDRRNRRSTTPSVSYTIKKVAISKYLKGTIILVTSLIYAFVNGMGMIEAGYLTSYVHESHFKLEMREGARMESSSWITHIISGIISIYVVKKIGLKWNLIIGVSMVVLSNVFMVIMSEISSSEYVMWIGITGISIGGCSFFSSLVSFMESIFPVSSRVASLYLVPNCLSNIIWPQIVGHLIETEPQVFIYSMAFCAIVSGILLTILLIVTKRFEGGKQNKV